MAFDCCISPAAIILAIISVISEDALVLLIRHIFISRYADFSLLLIIAAMMITPPSFRFTPQPCCHFADAAGFSPLPRRFAAGLSRDYASFRFSGVALRFSATPAEDALPSSPPAPRCRFAVSSDCAYFQFSIIFMFSPAPDFRFSAAFAERHFERCRDGRRQPP